MPAIGQEIFPNPVVQQVIFQIRFPDLFFLEERIGDFHLSIYENFPQSSVQVNQHVLLAKGPVDTPPPQAGRGLEKIWKFENDSGVILEVKLGSVTLLSNKHKSYKSDSQNNFRPVIELVLQKFKSVVPVSTVSRVGMRYIDHIPLEQRTSAALNDRLNTTLAVSRFPVESSREMLSRHQVVKEEAILRFEESLIERDEGEVAVSLDFDASVRDIKFDKILEAADKLHAVIRAEFEASVKESVFKYMREQIKTAEGDQNE